jgi:hypothetical protein
MQSLIHTRDNQPFPLQKISGVAAAGRDPRRAQRGKRQSAPRKSVVREAGGGQLPGYETRANGAQTREK